MSERKIPDRFGGVDSEAQNALREAMRVAAENQGYTHEYAEYELLEKTPRTSLTVYLVEALQELGYEIVKREATDGD